MPTAEFDFDRARFNMVEQQIRPWEVLDPTVLELLSVVRREDFVPPQFRALAFTDMELPLRLGSTETGEVMLAPKVEARLLQALGLKSHETVLELGAGSGFMAALAAHRAARVWTVEIQAPLVAFARENLQRAGIHNVTVEHGDGLEGEFGAGAPDTFDALIVSGSVPEVTTDLTDLLCVGGRMVVIVGEAPIMTAQRITRIAHDAFDTESLFETVTRPLVQKRARSHFTF